MTVCIQYSKPASGELEGEVYGLDVAVNNFLNAWFRYGSEEKFICRPIDIPSFDHFKELARANGVDESRCIGLNPRTPQHNLERISCIFRPDPLIGLPLWQRRQVAGKGYAVCGLVHTMSGERIARAVGDLALAPVTNTDALICPSDAIRGAVRNLWGLQSEFLDYRFGGKSECSMQTPVIPLGVDTEKFARMTAPGKREEQRKALGAAGDEIVILFVGRLSFATKAHPLPLWMVVERAAQLSGRKIRLVMYGYFKPKDMEPHFRNLANDTFKAAKIEFIQNGDARFPDQLWAGADIFASLSDNTQESFGLTPVEAMAAGLPAVISDWDGYRGAVRDGKDGFLVPTFAPPVETGLEIADHYYNEQNYGVSLTGASQSTAVDIARGAEVIAALAKDGALRRAMGAEGRARAQNNFDWKNVIKAYEALWKDLAAKRQAAAGKPEVPPNWQAAHPSFPNPWKMFESFPTKQLTDDYRMRVVMGADDIALLLKHEMNFYVPELLLPKEQLLELVEVIRRAEMPFIRDILAPFPAHQHARLWRCLGWMLKFGVCELHPRVSL